MFLIRDDHPLLGAMDFEPWDVTDDYLSGGGARTYDDSGTYTESSAGQIAHVRNHEWRHDLAEVVMALLQAGLVIESFAALPYMDWPAFPALVPCTHGWTLPPGTPRLAHPKTAVGLAVFNSAVRLAGSTPMRALAGRFGGSDDANLDLSDYR